MSEKTQQQSGSQIKMIDKIAYAAGDFGCNLSFVLAGTFFTLFYTQYMGISSLHFAGILILLKIWDAVNDPMLGAIIDNDQHKYKRNKFLQYIYFGSFGLAIAAVICFIPVPNASYAVKVILCVVGYMLWDAFYTIVNVPYGSVLTLLSDNAADRAQLSTWRSFGASLASVPVSMILPLILYDSNREVLGGRLIIVAAVLGVIALCAFQFMVRYSKVRVEIPPKQEKTKINYFKSLANFCKNRQAIGATLIPVAMFIGAYGTATASAVMFQAYFKNTAAQSILTFATYVPMFIMIPLVGKIVEKWGAKEASQTAMLLCIIVPILMLILPITPDNKGIMLYIVLYFINGFGFGIYNCVSWSLMANAIDYNEWMTGTREEGTIYAIHSFFRKLAQGVGPSLGLVIMVWLGYDSSLGAKQPDSVATAMRYLIPIFNLICAVVEYVGLRFIYNLDKKRLAQMEKELEEKRAAAAAAK